MNGIGGRPASSHGREARKLILYPLGQSDTFGLALAREDLIDFLGRGRIDEAPEQPLSIVALCADFLNDHVVAVYFVLASDLVGKPVMLNAANPHNDLSNIGVPKRQRGDPVRHDPAGGIRHQPAERPPLKKGNRCDARVAFERPRLPREAQGLSSFDTVPGDAQNPVAAYQLEPFHVPFAEGLVEFDVQTSGDFHSLVELHRFFHLFIRKRVDRGVPFEESPQSKQVRRQHR